MEYRKLIAFGKSSYVISIPKSWIQQNKLKKGDLVYLEEKENALVLNSQLTESDEEKKITISVDGKSFALLRRELNAAYINNFREIIFKGQELKDKSKTLLETIRELIALEVVELDSSRIITKDFLDMDKVSITELIKKMDLIVKYMLKDCSIAFQENTAENIDLRDKDVNRLSFLIYRVIRYGMRNQNKMIKLYNLNATDLLNYYWITFHLEEIADEAKRISRAMQKTNLPLGKQREFIKLLAQVEELYSQVIKYYYQKSGDKSLELSEKKSYFINAINSFSEQNKSSSEDITYMIDRFRRLVGSIHELNRLTHQY